MQGSRGAEEQVGGGAKWYFRFPQGCRSASQVLPRDAVRYGVRRLVSAFLLPRGP